MPKNIRARVNIMHGWRKNGGFCCDTTRVLPSTRTCMFSV